MASCREATEQAGNVAAESPRRRRTIIFIMKWISGRGKESTINPTAGMQIFQRVIGPDSWYATPITADGSDYTLTEVTGEIEDFGAAGTLFMEVWSVEGSPTYAPQAIIQRLSLVD
jgi:hypothetical protein